MENSTLPEAIPERHHLRARTIARRHPPSPEKLTSSFNCLQSLPVESLQSSPWDCSVAPGGPGAWHPPAGAGPRGRRSQGVRHRRDIGAAHQRGGVGDVSALRIPGAPRGLGLELPPGPRAIDGPPTGRSEIGRLVGRGLSGRRWWPAAAVNLRWFGPLPFNRLFYPLIDGGSINPVPSPSHVPQRLAYLRLLEG